SGDADILHSTGIDGDVFAHHVSITDFHARGFALVFFILRHAADRAETVEVIIGADASMTIDNAVGADFGARSDTYIGPDDAVGADFHVVSELCPFRNNGGLVN